MICSGNTAPSSVVWHARPRLRTLRYIYLHRSTAMPMADYASQRRLRHLSTLPTPWGPRCRATRRQSRPPAWHINTQPWLPCSASHASQSPVHVTSRRGKVETEDKTWIRLLCTPYWAQSRPQVEDLNIMPTPVTSMTGSICSACLGTPSSRHLGLGSISTPPPTPQLHHRRGPCIATAGPLQPGPPQPVGCRAR